MAVFADPFDEILDHDVFLKTVHQESHVGVAMGIHFDEVRYDHKRVGPDVFCIQFFNREGAFSGSHVDRVVKMEQEQFEVLFGCKLVWGQF